ncbi:MULTISPECIES: tyrosinase cofactor [Streptomyces]|uniref:tyrosinase cofactor n=1 Tax=Streptomyces TaxID=1883 RepID=UPI000691E5D2|nr:MULTISPECIES: tyrosinase cofactor [unclassified Streptomyces]KOT93407.1 tyrosinase [Streptomyces sp. NRRL F-4711]
MVVTTGTRAHDAATGGAERAREHGAEGAGPAAGRPVSGTRRQLMRGLLAPALAVGLAPLTAASRPPRATEAADGAAGPAHPEPRAAEPVDGAAFDETYRGRRIQGIRSAGGRAVGAGTWHVTVDGRPLHLMRRADGSWLSMVDHYRSYPTPLAAARGAVDELGPGEHLRATSSAGHDEHSGGRHGVHA